MPPFIEGLSEIVFEIEMPTEVWSMCTYVDICGEMNNLLD